MKTSGLTERNKWDCHLLHFTVESCLNFYAMLVGGEILLVRPCALNIKGSSMTGSKDPTVEINTSKSNLAGATHHQRSTSDDPLTTAFLQVLHVSIEIYEEDSE